MTLLVRATKSLLIGTAYAVWTGIDAVGILFFKEPAGFLWLLFLTTLVGSIVGLKFVSN